MGKQISDFRIEEVRRIKGVEEFADQGADVRQQRRDVFFEVREDFVVLVCSNEMAELQMTSFRSHTQSNKMYSRCSSVLKPP